MTTRNTGALAGGLNAVTLVLGNIVDLRFPVDAIVNAANERLAGGGGVDGAIHKAAGGQQLYLLTGPFRTAGGCPPGSAVITGAAALGERFQYPVRHIIHAVGPSWDPPYVGLPGLLRNAYAASFALAAQAGDQSVAVPSISTGVYGFPLGQAAPIAIHQAYVAARRPGSSLAVFLVQFSEEDHAFYAATEAALLRGDYFLSAGSTSDLAVRDGNGPVVPLLNEGDAALSMLENALMVHGGLRSHVTPDRANELAAQFATVTRPETVVDGGIVKRGKVDTWIQQVVVPEVPGIAQSIARQHGADKGILGNP